MNETYLDQLNQILTMILSNYMNSPVNEHGNAYVWNDVWNYPIHLLGIMIPFVKKSMELNMMGRTSKIFNEGRYGDISLSNITDIKLSNKSKLVLSYGFKLPTGKVNYRKATQKILI